MAFLKRPTTRVQFSLSADNPFGRTLQIPASITSLRGSVQLGGGVGAWTTASRMNIRLEIGNWGGCCEYAAAPMKAQDDYVLRTKPFTYSVGEAQDDGTLRGLAKTNRTKKSDLPCRLGREGHTASAAHGAGVRLAAKQSSKTGSTFSRTIAFFRFEVAQGTCEVGVSRRRGLSSLEQLLLPRGYALVLRLSFRRAPRGIHASAQLSKLSRNGFR